MEKLPQDKPIVKIIDGNFVDHFTGLEQQKEGWDPWSRGVWANRAQYNPNNLKIREEDFGAIFYGNSVVLLLNKPAYEMIKPKLNSLPEIEKELRKYI